MREATFRTCLPNGNARLNLPENIGTLDFKCFGAYIAGGNTAFGDYEGRRHTQACHQILNPVTDLDAAKKSAFLGVICEREEFSPGIANCCFTRAYDPFLLSDATVYLSIECVIASKN